MTDIQHNKSARLGTVLKHSHMKKNNFFSIKYSMLLHTIIPHTIEKMSVYYTYIYIMINLYGYMFRLSMSHLQAI
jgi:hypothetical protein